MLNDKTVYVFDYFEEIVSRPLIYNKDFRLILEIVLRPL